MKDLINTIEKMMTMLEDKEKSCVECELNKLEVCKSKYLFCSKTEYNIKKIKYLLSKIK